MLGFGLGLGFDVQRILVPCCAMASATTLIRYLQRLSIFFAEESVSFVSLRVFKRTLTTVDLSKF